ncbi:ran GTPase-activating protein 1 [Monosporozyma unispora]|nr:GTPase-activating protein [Kazachstania unispora]
MASLPFQTSYEENEVFSIAGKALKLTSKEDIQPFLNDLLKLDKVTKIDLSGNTISIDASIALATTIKSNKSIYENLTEVNFADLYTSRLVDEVVQSLEVLLPTFLLCDKLTIVNLSDNAFGLRTIDSLENYIANAIHLEHLILSNNGMGPFAGERIGKALFKLSQNKSTHNLPFLKTFICGRNRLENGSTLYLALGLKSHGPNLQNVKLYQNGIRPKGIMTLLEYGFKNCPSLQILDLQDNTFTTIASLKLAEVLPIWKDTLVELNLNDCLLKNKGGDAILQNFNQDVYSKLTKLKLEYNEIEQDSIENHLLNAIKDKNLPVLKDLELNGNRLDEDSETIDLLQGMFEEMELDDLEELDSEDEESENEESEDENETFKEIDITSIEKELSTLSVDQLSKDLANTKI